MELNERTLWECLIDEEIVGASFIYVSVNGMLSFKGNHQEMYKVLSYQLMMLLNVVEVTWEDSEVYIDVEIINND